MPNAIAPAIPDACIQLINSLGGPPLPTGTPVPILKVILENQAASQAQRSRLRLAESALLPTH